MISKTSKIVFIGLGVMGFPMAGHLLKSGLDVCVYNRKSQKSLDWFNHYQEQGFNGLERAETIAEACTKADFIFTCVGNDQDLQEVMLGEAGILANVKAGSIICDHTTSSAKLAKSLYEQAKLRNIGFLDAPVSGGQAGAEKGALSIMLGGDQADFDRVFPLLECYGKSICLIGESGSGQLAKMTNQICITGILEGLAEALYFGQAAGLDMQKVLSVISKGAAQSWQMDNRAFTMLEGKFNFGFAVDWMRKDLAFVLDEAQALDIKLPLVAQVDEYYAEVQKQGGGRLDTSSLMTRLTKKDK